MTLLGGTPRSGAAEDGLSGGGPAMTVDELVREGTRVLPLREGLPDPRRESSWLLARVLGVTEVWIRLHPTSQPPAAAAALFREWLARRAAGEPAHHLTGDCPFWGRGFTVTPDVLVPRPETELVVEVALELPLAASAKVLDIGTGSGCLALTLALERSGWQVLGVECSLAALRVAAANRSRHRVMIDLICGDLGEALFGGFDLVVANLPYVPTGRLSGLPPDVRREPVSALDGGRDGLDVIRRLLVDLPRLLRPCGGAVLEVGEGQAELVAVAAERCGLAPARRIQDLADVERVIVLERRG